MMGTGDLWGKWWLSALLTASLLATARPYAPIVFPKMSTQQILDEVALEDKKPPVKMYWDLYVAEDAWSHGPIEGLSAEPVVTAVLGDRVKKFTTLRQYISWRLAAEKRENTDLPWKAIPRGLPKHLATSPPSLLGTLDGVGRGGLVHIPTDLRERTEAFVRAHDDLQSAVDKFMAVGADGGKIKQDSTVDRGMSENSSENHGEEGPRRPRFAHLERHGGERGSNGPGVDGRGGIMDFAKTHVRKRYERFPKMLGTYDLDRQRSSEDDCSERYESNPGKAGQSDSADQTTRYTTSMQSTQGRGTSSQEGSGSDSPVRTEDLPSSGQQEDDSEKSVTKKISPDQTGNPSSPLRMNGGGKGGLGENFMSDVDADVLDKGRGAACTFVQSMSWRGTVYERAELRSRERDIARLGSGSLLLDFVREWSKRRLEVRVMACVGLGRSSVQLDSRLSKVKKDKGETDFPLSNMHLRGGMKLFTHNMVASPAPGADMAYPLVINATEVRIEPSNFDPELVKALLGRVDWGALLGAIEQVGGTDAIGLTAGLPTDKAEAISALAQEYSSRKVL